MITVFSPGALTTVQDLGRPGMGAHGVPPSGAFDPWSLRAANMLVGNDEGAAGLEITMAGPTLGFARDAVCALAGSPLDAHILVSLPGSEFERDVEPKPVPHGETFTVRAGESLRIGRAREGVRAYLAVRGGIAVEPVLGSRSTHATAGLGPRVGQSLDVGRAEDAPHRRLSGTWNIPAVIRAVARTDRLDPAPFFAATWTVSTSADRTGVRLEGPALDGPREIDPEGMPRGTVQVPGDRLPIVLGPDGPVTGGYAPVATVIAADLGHFAHLRPGATLRFEEITVEEARAAWHAREDELRRSVVDV